MNCLHLVLNPFVNDSRVLKITRTVMETGRFEKIFILARHAPGLAPREDLDAQRTVIRLRLLSEHLPASKISQALQLMEWNLRGALVACGLHVELVHCHDMTPLPLGVLLRALGGTRLVYDAHELETERSTVSAWMKPVLRSFERGLLRFTDGMITVSEGIAEWYRTHYHLAQSPTVVRNIPPKQSAPPAALSVGVPRLREKFKMGPSDVLFLSIGSLTAGRGILESVELFKNLLPTQHLVVVGSGSLEAAVRAAAEEFTNIHFLPAVPAHQVLEITAQGDVGLVTTDNSCLNHYFSLPNKLFEYLLGGIPVLVNDLREQRKIVMDYNCGWVMPADENQRISFLNALTADTLSDKKDGAMRAREDLDWKNEQVGVVELYQSLLGP